METSPRKYARPLLPDALVTRVVYNPRSLLAINTDALNALLHHGTHRKQLDPLSKHSDDDSLCFAARIELQMWIDTFIAETETYRSANIAAELLIERSSHACRTLRNPHLLTTAVSMALLFNLAPQFRRANELVMGLVDETAQAIFVTPARCASLSMAPQSFARSTFFDAFFDLVAAYHSQHDKAKKYELMQARGQRVLDRAIGMCRNDHAKRLLRQWHQLALRHKALKQKYRILFSKVSNGSIVEKAIQRWRQHAHHVHVESLVRHNLRGVEALQSIQLKHRKTDEALKAAQFEASRRDRALEAARVSVEVLKSKSIAIRTSTGVAHSDYSAARKKWANFIQPMFNDVRRVPYDLNLITWMKDIWADQAAASSEAATKRLTTRSRISPQTLLEVLEALAESASRRRSNAAQASHVTITVAQALGNTMEIADKICELFRFISGGLEPPLTPTDIVRGDQLKLRHFVALLMEMSAGGFACQFFTNAVATRTATPFVSRLRDEKFSEVAATHEAESIAADWREGHAQVCRGETLANVQNLRDRCMSDMIQFGEEVEFARTTQAFFDQLNVTGSITRGPLEKTLHTVFGNKEAIIAKWPDSDIVTVNDLASYLTEVSDVLKVDRLKLVLSTQREMAAFGDVAFLFDVFDEDVQLVMKSFEEDLKHVYRVHCETKSSDPGHFTPEAMDRLIEYITRNVTLGVSRDELMSLYHPSVHLLPDCGPATMAMVLSAVAMYFDPNPYLPTSVKLRVFFRTLFRSS